MEKILCHVDKDKKEGTVTTAPSGKSSGKAGKKKTGRRNYYDYIPCMETNKKTYQLNNLTSELILILPHTLHSLHLYCVLLFLKHIANIF